MDAELRDGSVTRCAVSFPPGLLRWAPGDASGLYPVTIELTQVRFQYQGNGRIEKPVGHDAYASADSLIIPMTIAAEIGLEGTFRTFLDADQVNLELRVQTVLPVEDVSFEMSVRVAGGGPIYNPRVPAEPREREVASNRPPSCLAIETARGAFVTLADVGEEGQIEIVRDGTAVEQRYSFFRRFLEKGVILVGRLAVGPLAGDPSPEAMRQLSVLWLARPSFL